MGGKKRRRAKDKELRKDNKQQPVSLASAATSTDPTNAHCEKKRRDSVAQAARYPATTAVLAIVAVCFVSYANGLDGDFVFDDTVAIVTNADVQSNGSTDFSAIWNHDFWGKDIKSEQSHKSFRPLTTLSFRASFLMSGSTLEGGECTPTIAFTLHPLLGSPYARAAPRNICVSRAQRIRSRVCLWTAVLCSLYGPGVGL